MHRSVEVHIDLRHAPALVQGFREADAEGGEGMSKLDEAIEPLPEPFTPAEAAFWTVLNEADELSSFYPDEPDVNYIPRARWRQAMWEAVQAIRREDQAIGGWPASIQAKGKS